MTVHERVFTAMVQIIDTAPSITSTIVGKPTPLAQERSWDSVYLIPGADTFKPRDLGTSVAAYDNSLLIRCIVNVNCDKYGLQWAVTRDEVIQAVLKDSEIWGDIVDRDIVSIVYDDMNSFPLMAMELLFEFKLREECS